MNFSDIPAGEMVFLDANVFIHFFGRDPDFGPPARDLLRRIENGELRGVTTTHILAEVLHRLMTIEAMQTFGWPYAGIAQRLRQHLDSIERLHLFQKCVREISDSPVAIHEVTLANLSEATAISAAQGLLTNDAIVIAAMRELGLNLIASEDADFDRVSEVKRFAAK